MKNTRIIEDLSIIEDGIYVGVLMGYSIQIAFRNGNVSQKLTTDYGIRGMSEVLVKVENGKGYLCSFEQSEIRKVIDSYNVKPDFFKMNLYNKINGQA
ncbi:MAG: hypothetical protein ACRDD8_10095 [Bacteroidales bacterium]